MGLRMVTDVCVVGAGIVGLAHALEARRRGLDVVVIEREERAIGASVRNFGHVFVTGMADGPALDYALAARERWLELAPAAGLEVIAGGSVLVARHDDELEVLEHVATDERRCARMLTPAEVAELAPIPTESLLGALHARLDLRVDPRRAAAALAGLLARDPGARLLWSAHVHAIEPGAVFAEETVVHAAEILVCPGPSYGALPPLVRPRREGLTRCRLQMLRVGSPPGRRYVPALLTGLSLIRYPAFTSAPAAARVRARLAAAEPDAVAAGIHLIVTQLADGDLILGDTHDYGDSPAPFADERLDEIVLAHARELLGAAHLPVRERWQGSYPSAPGDPFLVQSPMAGVRVIEVVSGIGMTTALGLAGAVLDDLGAAQRAA